MTAAPSTIAVTYIRAWIEKDFNTLRDLLADDVTFSGPLARVDNAEDCIQGLRQMSKIVTDLVVHELLPLAGVRRRAPALPPHPPRPARPQRRHGCPAGRIGDPLPLAPLLTPPIRRLRACAVTMMAMLRDSWVLPACGLGPGLPAGRTGPVCAG